MTLGKKFCGLLAAMFWAGIDFQVGANYMGWALVGISVALAAACLYHYHDPKSFKE